MKKVFAILFCFVYLVSSAGVHFNLHYCGGKIKNISLSHSDEADCCGRKMKKKDCCKEKAISYKVKDNQDHSTKQLLVKPAQITKAAVAVISTDLFSTIQAKPSIQVYTEPPDVGSAPLFLTIRILRI